MNNNNKIQEELLLLVNNAIINALLEDAIFSVTDEKGNIIFANPRFAEISKYPVEELLGQNHRILKSGDQPQKLFTDMWASISSGKVWRGEIKNKAKDGSFYWVEAIVFPIVGNDGKINSYASVRTVINERKEYEENAKKHLRELEQMNKFIVDRELRMVELKKEIKRLEGELAEAGSPKI